MEILTDTMFLGNPLIEWAQAIGYFGGSIVVARVMYMLFKNVFTRLAAKTKTKWDDIIVDQVEEEDEHHAPAPKEGSRFSRAMHWATPRYHFEKPLRLVNPWIAIKQRF